MIIARDRLTDRNLEDRSVTVAFDTLTTLPSDLFEGAHANFVRVYGVHQVELSGAASRN